MRLVPDQDPRECYECLLRYLESHAAADIRWRAERIGGGRASLVDRSCPGVQAM